MAESNIPAIPDRHPARRLSLITNNLDRPLSFASTTSYSPNIVPAATSPTRSLVTEIFNSRPFQRSNTGGSSDLAHSPGSERARLGSQETSRFNFVSGISDLYGSTEGIKTQPSQRSKQRAAVSPLERRISAPMAVSDSLGFNGETPLMASTRALETPRQSDATTRTEGSAFSDATRTNYHTALREVDGMVEPVEEWPLPTPPGSSQRNDFHELPAPSSAHTTMSPKAAAVLDHPMDDRIAAPSPRAPKFSRVPFLSKMFKSSAAKDKSTGSMMEYHRDEKPPPPPPKS